MLLASITHGLVTMAGLVTSRHSRQVEAITVIGQAPYARHQETSIDRQNDNSTKEQ